MINTMETSQALANDSFSYSWLTNRRISFDSPTTEPLGKSMEETQNFNFDFPISRSPGALVHADEIFCDGYIRPKYGDWSKKELFDTSYSVASIPTSSIPSRKTRPADRSHCQFLKKWGKSSQRIFHKCIGFLRPSCGKVGCSRTRSSIRVDDIDGKAVLGVEISWNGSPQPSPPQGSANSEKNWRKSTAATADTNRGLGKARSCSHLSQLTPSYSTDDWSSKSSIHKAIPHCKLSFDREAADLNEIRQPLKEETVAPSMEGVGRENNFELGQDDPVKLEEFVAKAEVNRPEFSLAEHQNHGVKASKSEVIRAELSLADNDNCGGEASELEILIEPSTLENKILGGEASNLAEPQLELLSTHSGILGGEQREDLEMVNHEDNCLKGSEVPIMGFVDLGGEASKPGEPQPELSPARNEIHIEMIDDDDDVPIEETKESEMENQEFLTPQVLEAVPAGNDKVIEQPFESEIIKEEALAEGKLIPISPTTSQESLASEKGSEILKDNEKLREMMQKLLEVGNEQLTAISNLSGRVKDLEKKLARKKKLRTTRLRAGRPTIKLFSIREHTENFSVNNNSLFENILLLQLI